MLEVMLTIFIFVPGQETKVERKFVPSMEICEKMKNSIVYPKVELGKTTPEGGKAAGCKYVTRV